MFGSPRKLNIAAKANAKGITIVFWKTWLRKWVSMGKCLKLWRWKIRGTIFLEIRSSNLLTKSKLQKLWNRPISAIILEGQFAVNFLQSLILTTLDVGTMFLGTVSGARFVPDYSHKDGKESSETFGFNNEKVFQWSGVRQFRTFHGESQVGVQISEIECKLISQRWGCWKKETGWLSHRRKWEKQKKVHWTLEFRTGSKAGRPSAKDGESCTISKYKRIKFVQTKLSLMTSDLAKRHSHEFMSCYDQFWRMWLMI